MHEIPKYFLSTENQEQSPHAALTPGPLLLDVKEQPRLPVSPSEEAEQAETNSSRGGASTRGARRLMP